MIIIDKDFISIEELSLRRVPIKSNPASLIFRSSFQIEQILHVERKFDFDLYELVCKVSSDVDQVQRSLIERTIDMKPSGFVTISTAVPAPGLMLEENMVLTYPATRAVTHESFMYLSSFSDTTNPGCARAMKIKGDGRVYSEIFHLLSPYSSLYTACANNCAARVLTSFSEVSIRKLYDCLD